VKDKPLYSVWTRLLGSAVLTGIQAKPGKVTIQVDREAFYELERRRREGRA